MHQTNNAVSIRASAPFRLFKTDPRITPLHGSQFGQSSREWSSSGVTATITMLFRLYASMPTRTEMGPVGLPVIAPGARPTHFSLNVAVPRHCPDRGTASCPI